MTDRGISRPDAGEQTVVERVDPFVGTVIDKRYRVDFRLAAGGFGAIYRATHLKSGHQVALKVLHRELATDPRVVARFRREGDALIALRDPHTVTAYEIGETGDGALFIVMELLRGESLYERFRGRGPLPWREMVGVAIAICSSLAEAHGRGIVHRDLKPANIQLEPRPGGPDFVKVLDFGIAKILNGSGDNHDLTNAGQMIGTFDYMSPEQMVGGCTTRSDIYTLGVLTYEMICGARPFDEAANPTALLAALVTRSPPRLSARARVPPELDRIVMRCLEKEPTARYADVSELRRDLERLIAPSLAPDDEATRAIHIPAGATPTAASAAVNGDDATWLADLPSPPPPPVAAPDSGQLTPVRPRVTHKTAPPIPPPIPDRDPPTPVYVAAPPVPAQPPVVFPPTPSVARRPHPSSRPPTPPVPLPVTTEPASAPMFPAGAYHAPATSPPWPAPPAPPQDFAGRPSQVEVPAFDMAAVSSRDAWVGRIVWVILLAIAVIAALFLTGHL